MFLRYVGYLTINYTGLYVSQKTELSEIALAPAGNRTPIPRPTSMQPVAIRN
jgi:hypothetical protein